MPNWARSGSAGRRPLGEQGQAAAERGVNLRNRAAGAILAEEPAAEDVAIPGGAGQRQRILRACRQLGPVTIVLAHMGGWRCWEDVQALLPDTDVYLDTAFSLGALTSRTGTAKDCSLLSDDAFCRIVRQFGARRIVFGTDCPWGSPRQDLQHIRALPLMAAEKAAILGSNAKRILNL